MVEFIGQPNIVNEVNLLIKESRRNPYFKFNLLLRGQAGCGKTHLAKSILQDLFRDNYTIMLPAETNGNLQITRSTLKYPGMFIDEVHTAKGVEKLFPFMDSKIYVFILATNIFTPLGDALVSRCISFLFRPYVLKDLIEIGTNFAQTSRLNIAKKDIVEIASRSRGNPRLLKQYIERVSYFGTSAKSALDSMGVLKDGFTTYDVEYLNLLKVHTTLSASALCSMLRVTNEYLINEIEPFLLEKNLIKITSRGRQLV